jgi:hypothetical protein
MPMFIFPETELEKKLCFEKLKITLSSEIVSICIFAFISKTNEKCIVKEKFIKINSLKYKSGYFHERY